MPNRILKEAAWSSESLSRVSLLAQGFFLRLLPLPDDHGCFDARVAILRARLFPLNYGQVTEKQLEGWIQELIAVDCIRVWTDSGVRYGYIPAWSKHQTVRSLHHRKTPSPPLQIITGSATETDAENKGDSSCKQVPAVESLNPNPNLNPVPPMAPQGGESAYPADFIEYLWEPYPKKTEKLEALKVWKKLNPSQAVKEKIRRAIQSARASPKWIEEGGRFIPNPAKWLRRGNWEDEIQPLRAVARPGFTY